MDFIKDMKNWVKGEEPKKEDKAVPSMKKPKVPPMPTKQPLRDFIKIHNLYSRISSIDSIDFFDDTEQEVSVQFKNGNIIKQTIADTQDYNRIKQILTKLFQ